MTRTAGYFGRLILSLVILLSLAPAAARAREQSPEHFYFVQITDTHLGDRDNLMRTVKVIEAINRLPMKIGFVVHTGDIFNDNMEDEKVMRECRAAMKKLKAPVHFLPGNNDIDPANKDATVKTYADNFGRLISMASYNGVVFIFVYTEPLRKGFSIDGYRPLEMLARYLEKSKGKPVVIFHHAPSAADFYSNKFHPGWPEKVRKRWISLVNAYDVKAVITGHFHRDELHWLKDVPLYVAPPVSGYWGRQASFRIYEYDHGRIGYRTRYIQP